MRQRKRDVTETFGPSQTAEVLSAARSPSANSYCELRHSRVSAQTIDHPSCRTRIAANVVAERAIRFETKAGGGRGAGPARRHCSDNRSTKRTLASSLES